MITQDKLGNLGDISNKDQVHKIFGDFWSNYINSGWNPNIFNPTVTDEQNSSHDLLGTIFFI